MSEWWPTLGERKTRFVSSTAALFVAVSGPPGSGKTTLAVKLAEEMGLTLLSKDTIKESLMSVMPPKDVEASRHLGKAAMALLFAVASASPQGAVLEANFSRSLSTRELGTLPGTMIELFCRCDQTIGLERYRQRISLRHAGHFDAERSDEELWNDQVTQPVAGGWPVLEVRTDEPVDVPHVAELVLQAIL